VKYYKNFIKIGIQEVTLHKALWGDFFLNTKLKKAEKRQDVKGKNRVGKEFFLIRVRLG